jgi:hypothetical protein
LTPIRLTCFGVKNAEQEHVSALTTMLYCEQRQIVLVVNLISFSVWSSVFPVNSWQRFRICPARSATEEVERLKQIWNLEPGQPKAES